MKKQNKYALLASIVCTTMAIVLYSLAFFGCAPTGGQSDISLHEDSGLPLECQGAHLDPKTPTGQMVNIDGGDYLLRDVENLYTSQELLDSVDVRHCPLCLDHDSLACTRHFDDVNCELLPARPSAPHNCANPQAPVICSDCSHPTVLLNCNPGILQLVDPCGCDEAFILSSTGLVLCPNDDAWDPLAILTL